MSEGGPALSGPAGEKQNASFDGPSADPGLF